MPTPDSQRLSLAILVLAGLLLGLPWAVGGRSPVGQASLVLLLALAGAIASTSESLGLIIRPSPLALAGGALAAGSALHTIYPDRTAQFLLLLLAYVLAATVAASGVREVPWAERLLLAAIVLSGALVSIVGMLRIALGTEGGLYARLLTGPFGYPNAMGGYLLLVGGAAQAMARADRNPLLRGTGILAAALAAGGIYLTGSRGVLAAAALGLAFWAMVERDRWWSRRRLWVPLAGLGLLAALTWAASRWGSGLVRLWQQGAGAWDPSFLWRAHILRWTWEMVRDHPLWGVGPGAFPVALKHYQRLPYVGGENPHNFYLELAADYGLPAAILATLSLGAYLGRLSLAVARAGSNDPKRRRLAPLLAALVAFALHSAVDLDWSFPVIALTAATLLGLVSAGLRATRERRHRTAPGWRVIWFLLLAVAGVLALSRYYSTILVTWARLGLAAGERAAPERNLTWALRLNPLSFPAHQWMARARLRSGDAQGAAEVAERAARIAPLDPDSQALAGEVALATGRWEIALERFRRAVERAPYAALSPYADLMEAGARGGKAADARWWYEKAVGIFNPDQVLADEARCLAPGDRYLLARMNRLAARLHGEAGDTSRQQAIAEQARRLAQPDPRGICATGARAGQTSPEATAETFWRAFAEGGWAWVENLLIPELASETVRMSSDRWVLEERPRRAGILWIASLRGGERQARLRLEVEIETATGRLTRHCSQMDFRLKKDAWFLETLPILEPRPCPL